MHRQDILHNKVIKTCDSELQGQQYITLITMLMVQLSRNKSCYLVIKSTFINTLFPVHQPYIFRHCIKIYYVFYHLEIHPKFLNYIEI